MFYYLDSIFYQNMPLNISCIGSINFDNYSLKKNIQNIKQNSESKSKLNSEFNSMLNVEPNLKLNNSGHEMKFIGGSASNTCYFLQSLIRKSRIKFAHPYLVGVVGKDKMGEVLYSNLKARGFNLNYIKKWKGTSGNTTITLDSNGERIITREDSVTKYLMHLVSFQNTKFIINDSFVHVKANHLVIREILNTKNTIFSADISGFLDYSWELDTYLNKKPELSIKILFGNEIEFITLHSEIFKEKNAIDIRKMENEEKARVIREILPRFRATSAYLKMGKKGALYISKNSWIYCPVINVDIVDTTGAGDAFNAGIIFGILNNRSQENVLKLGCVLGTLNCTTLGAQSWVIDIDKLNNKVNSLKILKSD